MDLRTRLGALALGALVAACAPRAAAQSTRRVSVTGLNTNATSTDLYPPSVSADGRFVAFVSYASNLVPGDNNGHADVFVRDTATGTVRRASIATDGTEADAASGCPAITADGRYVAFNSLASNLVSGDTPETEDIFLHDTQTGETRRISQTPDGGTPNGDSDTVVISPDGRYLVFDSLASNLVPGDTNESWDVFRYDTQTGATTRVSVGTDGAQGNDDSYFPSLSANGRFIVFGSYADNFTPADINNEEDVFLHDIQAGTTTLVSVGTSGAPGNDASEQASISADGRYVAFDSRASNLVAGDTNGTWDVFLRDRQAGTTIRLSVGPGGAQSNEESGFPVITPDGRFVVFESMASNLVATDTNASSDVFLRDVAAGVTTRVSVAPDGAQGNDMSYGPTISADGAVIAFYSAASNLTPGDTNGADDVFRRERVTGAMQRVTELVRPGESNGPSGAGGIAVSAEGRYVAFASTAANLVPDDVNGASDIFLHDSVTSATRRVSVSTGGDPGADASVSPAISPDGRYVAFASLADNLVLGDNNGKSDIFLHDTQTGETRRVSTGTGGTPSDGDSETPSFSPDGGFIAFASAATNLVPGDTNEHKDIFVYEISSGLLRRVSVGAGGAQANGDSREPSAATGVIRVAFTSDATNLVADDTNGVSDVFLRDTFAGQTIRVSLGPDGAQANGASHSPAANGNGRFVAFASDATNLGPAGPSGVTAIYRRDTFTGVTRPVSVSVGSAPANAESAGPSIDVDGRFVGFVSLASNLVPADTNGAWDAFLRDMETGVVQRASVATNMEEANADTRLAVLSGNGHNVAFASPASNLVSADTNGLLDVFVRGPLGVPTPPATAEAALRAAGGLAAAADDASRLDADSSGAVTIADAVTLARKAAGLQP